MEGMREESQRDLMMKKFGKKVDRIENGKVTFEDGSQEEISKEVKANLKFRK
jgi:hypothetical protein